MIEPHDKHEHHLLRDAQDADDWAWRRAIRQRPAALAAYRVVVFVLGLALVVLGLALVPLPGPGWLVVLLGLAIWASEFEPAQHVLTFAREKLRAWNDWVRQQPWYVQVGFALLTTVFVAAVLWTSLRLSGVPAMLPDPIEDRLVEWGRLPRSHHR